MQFTQTLFAAVLAATSVSAAPTIEARDPAWIIENMKRTCNGADTSCTWDFTINTQIAKPTHCSYVVPARDGKPASRSTGGAVTCGAFTITSGWSGQFAVGFTTLAVVDYHKNRLVWPAYNDNEIGKKGEVVKPNKSYNPQAPPS